MKAVVAAFNQEKALVGAFSVIVQSVVELMDSFTALALLCCAAGGWTVDPQTAMLRHYSLVWPSLSFPATTDKQAVKLFKY